MNKLKLYPYQEEGVRFLTDPKHRHRYLADDPGLGKTIQTIEAANKLQAKTLLVVCPASIKRAWLRELGKYSENFNAKNIFLVEGSKKTPPSDADCVIVNYDMVSKSAFKEQIIRWAKSRGGLDLLVMDEAHYLKNPESKRSSALLSQTGLIHLTKRSILLSGTPILNRPIELYLPLRVLSPTLLGKYTEYVDFGRRYCRGYQNNGAWDFRGASNIEELGERIKPFFLRRLKTEVLSQLPNKIYTTIPVVTRLRDMSDLPTSTRMNMIGECKIPRVVEYINDILEVEDKVVVFAHHRSVINALQGKLTVGNPVVLHGGMTSLQKQDSIDEFIHNPLCQVFIAQTQAGGVGIDGLQKVCSRVVFAELEWSPSAMDQAADRLHRMGQHRPVSVDFVILEESDDETVLEVLNRKRGVIQKTLDDPRDLVNYDETEKQLMSLEEELKQVNLTLQKTNETLVALLSQMSPAILNEAPQPPVAKEQKKKTPKAKAEEPAVEKAEEVVEPVEEEATESEAELDYATEIKKFLETYILRAEVEDDVKAARRAQVIALTSSFGAATSKEVPEDRKPEYFNALQALEPILSVEV